MEEEEKNTDHHHQQQQTHPIASPKEEQETVLSHLVPPDDHMQLRLLIDTEEFGSVFQAVEGGLRRLFLRGETAGEGGEGGEDAGGEGGESSKAGGASADKSSNPNRSERKCRSALEKLGMKPLTGVHEVMFVKAVEGNTKLVCSILKPDVFKLPSSENYVIFGELSTSLLQPQDDTMDLNESSELAGEYKSDEDEYDTDETGINPGDIELVMEEAAVSRWKAVKALKMHGGNIVSAILRLSPPSEDSDSYQQGI